MGWAAVGLLLHLSRNFEALTCGFFISQLTCGCLHLHGSCWLRKFRLTERFHFCTISSIYSCFPDLGKFSSLSHKQPVALISICVRAFEINWHWSHCFLGQVEPEKTKYKSGLRYLLAVWHWKGCFTSLCLTFHIYKMSYENAWLAGC